MIKNVHFNVDIYTRVGCDFAKDPMEFYHFVPLSFFMFL